MVQLGLGAALVSVFSAMVLLWAVYTHRRDRRRYRDVVPLMTQLIEHDRSIRPSRKKIGTKSVRSRTGEENAEHAQMLDNAWKSLDEGRPVKALESVLQVVREQSGEIGVWETLTRTRATELRRRSQLQSSKTADAEPKFTEVEDERDINTNDSVFAEYGDGRDDDAAASASSFMCSKCGGVFAQERKLAHETAWCPML